MAAPAQVLTVSSSPQALQSSGRKDLQYWIRLQSHETVNPQSKTHGAPSDDERHVGDLGNFKTDAQGNAQGSVQDKLVQLIGPQSVLGVCIHVASALVSDKS